MECDDTEQRREERKKSYFECEEAERSKAEERKESYVKCDGAEQSRGEEGVLCGM